MSHSLRPASHTCDGVVGGSLPCAKDPDVRRGRRQTWADVEAVCVSAWRGRDKSQELERLAALAGEASAEAAHARVVSEAAEPPVPPAPPDLTAAAFFDVDNTMMMGASIFYFARGLAARKFFTSSDLAGFVCGQIKFRLGGRENKEDIRTHRERALSFVA